MNTQPVEVRASAGGDAYTTRRIPQDEREERFLRGNFARPKKNGMAELGATRDRVYCKLRKSSKQMKEKTRIYLKGRLG